jgi:hypothetical protein
MNRVYLLRTPDFQINSGGIRVMWGLYGYLLAKGQEVYVNAKIDKPSIGIYPEIYHGNDMESKKVIRYVLQKPGLAGTDIDGKFTLGPNEFDNNDEIYCFSRVYDQWNLPDDHILFLPIIDLHTFKDLGKKRTKTAFYCARGVNLYKHPKDAIEITREMALDPKALAELLNECQTLYVYDEITAMLEVARLCGCKIEYWGTTPLDTLMKYETGMNGLGYRESKELDTKAFLEHYVNLKKEFEIKLDIFIDKTQHD